MAVGTSKTRKATGKLSRKSALSLGMTLAASMAVSTTVQAAAPIVVTQVEHGTAGFATLGNTTTITAANQTIIDYSKFDIPTGDTVRFIQPGAAATVLNRISGASPTAIDGSLFANGIVYMVNPAGVMFGQGAVINVGQIFAAAGNLSNSDFLHGVNHFTDVTGSVLNAGNIHASAVNFVGHMVANSGEIIAPKGTVVMAAGNDVLIGKMDGNMFVKVSDSGTLAAPGARAAVSNTGTVDAAGGQVNMSAGDMFSLAIRNTGTVTAGNITLHGGSKSTVLVSGTLDAANQGADKTGGTIKINGGNIGVGVTEHADGSFADTKTLLTAAGINGGGKILIGVNADSTSATGYSDASNYDYIGADALLNASATVSGAGGLVDTSGATLTVSPTATILTAGAGGGAAGQWLLDPLDILITGGTSTNIGIVTTPGAAGAAATTEFSPTGANPSPATVAASAITAALTAGDNVTLSTTPQTGPDVGPSNGGDITLVAGATIDPVVPAGSVVLLEFNGNNDINIAGTILPALTSAGIMNVYLSTPGNIYIGGVGTTPGGGFISTKSSASIGGYVNLDSTGHQIYIDSTAQWAINTSGALGGGFVEMKVAGSIEIPGGAGGTPGAPGPGGIATGGGALLMDASGSGTDFSIGAITISTAGYGSGTGGGAMLLFTRGLGNMLFSGTTFNSDGAHGAASAAGAVGAYGGGGAIALVSSQGNGAIGGQITLANCTFNSEGNGGGKVQIWPGGGEAGAFYEPINPQAVAPNNDSNANYPLGDGFLLLEGANTFNTAQLGPVVAGSGTGGGINVGVAVTSAPNFNLDVTWTVTGGSGGAATNVGGATTAATAGGSAVAYFYNIYGHGESSSGAGTAPNGVASGTAGPSEFDAFLTYFEPYLQANGGGSYTTIQPSVTSDGGGQDYENAVLPPGELKPASYKTAPYIVGDILVGGTQGVAAAATATLTDTGGTAAGSITLNGMVDGVQQGVDNLVTTTAAGDIRYQYTVGQNVPLNNWTANAGTGLSNNQFIPVTTSTLADSIGQVQLASGPGVTKPNFDIPFGEGFFYGTTSGNIYLKGTIVDANTNNIGVNQPFYPGAVTINTIALSGGIAGNIDLEAYMYGAYNQNSGSGFESSPLTLISPAPFTVNGQPNSAITIDATVVPQASIYAAGAATPALTINASGGYQDTATPISYSGFALLATNGGNIYMGGAAPAPALGGAGAHPISEGGYTVNTGGSVSLLATNPAGNAGNIFTGPSVYLSGSAVSIASVGLTGNAGNLAFSEGTKINGSSVAVTSLNLSPTRGFTSGNITFYLSDPTHTATESSITSIGQVVIVSGNYSGNAGNVNLGGYLSVKGGASYTAAIESVAASNGDPFTGMSGALTITNAANITYTQQFAAGLPFAAPTGLTGLSGNAGYVTIGSEVSIQSGGGALSNLSGAVAVGSYSNIGNAGYVSIGTGDALHGIVSSGGNVSIFSEAVLGTQATATSASPGNVTVEGTISTQSQASAGAILIQTIGTGASSAANVTIGGTGLLDASAIDPSFNGGEVAVYAPYGIVTINLTAPTAFAINTNAAAQAGDVNIYGKTGVDIMAGGISAQGAINDGKGGGGGVAIASGGYITVHQANINASSAYGGGGGVAIFSTASGTAGPVDLGSGSVINTSGGGFGGGGAVLIAGSGNVSISGATITASGNGGGAIALDSGAGKIIFASTDTFTSLQVGTTNAGLGGGAGYSVALTTSPQTLNVGGGGGATGGYAGGGVALTGVPSVTGGTFTDGIVVSPGFGSGTPSGATSSGGGFIPGTGGTTGGGNAGNPGRLAFSGNEIDFGITGSTTPVTVTTNGNGQIYNTNIVLYAPATLTESGSGNILLNGSGTAPSISTAAGVTAGLTVIDNSGNIVFGPNFTFATGSTALSSLNVTDTSGQIQIFTGGGNFISTTSGAQTFSGNTFVEETGTTGTFVINAGGEITLTGSLTGVASGTTTAHPLAVSLISSQAYASGAYAIDVGLNISTGGGNFLADASGGGNIQLGLFGTGATASTINTTGTTSNGSITIESIASSGNSGGIVMSPAGESLVTGGAGSGAATPTGAGSVFLESSAVAGTAHNVNVTGAINTSSTTGNGGDVTIQTIGQSGTTAGNITIGSSTGAAGTGYITTASAATGFSGGNVVLNSGTGTVNVNTVGDPGIAINTSGSPGGAVTLTGYNGLNLSAGNITSGGGIITLQNQTGLLSLGALTLDSSAATGGGNILIQTQSGGNGNIQLNGTSVNSGSTTTDNGGAITIKSLGTLTLDGADEFNSSGPVSSGTPGAIILSAAGNLTETSTAGLTFALSGDANAVTVTFNPGTPTGTVNLAGSLAFTGSYTGTTGPDANLTINSLGALALGTMNGDFALVVNTLNGGITFNGALGQTTALDSVTATAGTGSGSTTGSVTVNGAITTVNAISLQPNRSTYLGGAGPGDYRPDGILAINANLTSTNGNIDLSPAGRGVVPSVASITSNTPVVISAPHGNITMGQNERYTGLQSVTIAAGMGAGNTATIGDIDSLGNLTVSGNTIDILLRQPGAILTSFGSLDSGVSSTNGTEFIANGPITFTGNVITTGTGTAPRFASAADAGSVPAPYAINFYGAGTPFAGRAISPSFANYNGTVLVLSASGPVAQLIQLYTQNIAPVLPENLPTVEYTVVPEPTTTSWNQAILQSVGVATSSSSARRILAGMMGATVYQNGMYNTAGASLPPGQYSPQAVQNFLDVYHKLFSFEVPANYSPYKPSGWFNRPTWYEVAGRHKDIHNTLSLAYSLYQDSLGASPANDSFLQFVNRNRTQSKIFKQAATYMALLHKLSEALYQMGVTPSEFAAIEAKFFKPLAPDGMPFDEFMSEIAPAQLLPAGQQAE